MKFSNWGKFILVLVFSSFIFSFSSQSDFFEPDLSLDSYVVEDGFELSIIASEPHFSAPVAMDFDDRGRMWVVEMRGYMPNLEGIGEEVPNGRITILEDLDNDGKIDHSKVFLDELVLPRAIAHAYGGLLYTDGPALYFVKIKKNDKPGKPVLVDPIYADGGNVEHQPNGLMLNIDNWIYNANTNFRYRLKDGEWLKEPSSYRGQWGITKDNFGRLYVNNNSTQLQGDHVLPNTLIRNEYFKPSSSVNQTLTRNQRVYPLHATAVNRGYMDGVLDEKGYLVNVTASCGPLVYRGANFPADYDQNVFVSVPEANLIKRNILTFLPTETEAEQAWDDKEFIASTDEGFRPVNLFNGPDGAMYIVDMHRGIIQHKAFISQYLTKLLAEKQLDTMQNQGRILKVIHKDKPLNAYPNFAKAKKKELVSLLSHPNGFVRDRAQQKLIQKDSKSVQKDLIALAKSDAKPLGSLHALYTLEGLDLLSFDLLKEILEATSNDEKMAHVLRLFEGFASVSNSSEMAGIINSVLAEENEFLDLYVAISLQPWVQVSPDIYLPILAEIGKKHSRDKVVSEAIVSSIGGLEKRFMDEYKTTGRLKRNIKKAIESRDDEKMNSIFVRESGKDDTRTNGLKLFRTICGACHGADGSGIAGLAPPLTNSEYIDGSIQRLASIILHGISGPLHVGGKLYELNNDMPGLINNPDITDQDVVDITHFLQNAYAKQGKRISVEEVAKLRQEPPVNGVYSEKELLENRFEK
ncbi:DUF7133 domain-containing protein [Jiulongibacter sp. NS-SX5]|uniref:DUF7133 domain-containing protein n=1 Tax=Jiulongibacter sp. NS-SX5 TaxID=3463854 RepID=UPI00405A08E9